jgi:hypothetical protein
MKDDFGLPNYQLSKLALQAQGRAEGDALRTRLTMAIDQINRHGHRAALPMGSDSRRS